MSKINLTYENGTFGTSGVDDRVEGFVTNDRKFIIQDNIGVIFDSSVNNTGSSGTSGISGSSGTSGANGQNGISAGRIYYFNQSQNSDISPYKVLAQEPTTGGTQTVTVSVPGNSTALVQEFITPQLGFNVIPSGVQRFYLYYTKPSTNDDISAYLTLQLANATGGTIGTLITSQINSIGYNNGNPDETVIEVVFPTTNIDPTNRMIVKLYANNNDSSAHNLVFTTENGYYSFVVTSVAQTLSTSGTSGVNGASGSSGTSGANGTSGTSGTSGVTGAPGTSGTSGIRGTSGTSGVNGAVGGVHYIFETTTTGSGTGSGRVRYNNSNMSLVTRIFISNEDVPTNDMADWILGFDDSTTTSNRGQLILQSRITGTIVDIFNITGATINQSGYYELLVQYVDGVRPANNDNLSVSFIRTGNAGTSGTSGVTGASGTSGISGTSGTSGSRGTSGTSGLNGYSQWTPVFSSGVTINSDNEILRINSGGTWDEGFSSLQGYLAASVSAQPARIPTTAFVGRCMIGLNSDPRPFNDLNTIDYCIGTPDPDGLIKIYESGSLVYTHTTGATLDTLYTVSYDGLNVRYYVDNVLLRTTPRTLGNLVYLDASLYNGGGASGFKNVTFTPNGISNSYQIKNNITLVGTGFTINTGTTLYEFVLTDASILSTSLVDYVPYNSSIPNVVSMDLYPYMEVASGSVKFFCKNNPTGNVVGDLIIFN